MDLKNKVALITGGARGMGKAYAEAVLKAGGKVSILDVLEEEGSETDKVFREQFGTKSSKFIKCDVSNTEELEKSFRDTKEYFGQLDIVVNNAGIYKEGRKYDSALIDINLKAVIKGTYLALDYLRQDQGGPGGVIVNISSLTGIYILNCEAVAVYTAAKQGVLGFTRCLALSIGEPSAGHGVKLLCMCPGVIDTFLLREIFVADPEFARVTDDIGYVSLSTMAEGLMKLLNDDNNHGGVLAVTPEGMKYHYPEHLATQST